jgi:uncharacterized protein (TIGR00730 family)
MLDLYEQSPLFHFPNKMKNNMTSETQVNPAGLNMAASEQWAPKETSVDESKKVLIRSVCVYCGSSSRVNERYKENAKILGTMLAQKGIDVVYGGGRVGLMGIVADAAMNAGGKVIGIIPQHIQSKEIEHHGLTELHVVDSMHTRKRMMAEKSDAFVVLPGGFGTLDEAFEIITWKQLQLHEKPVIIFDDGGFWDPLIKLMDNLINEGFATQRHRSLYQVAHSLPEVFEILKQPIVPPPPIETKWL